MMMVAGVSSEFKKYDLPTAALMNTALFSFFFDLTVTSVLIFQALWGLL